MPPTATQSDSEDSASTSLRSGSLLSGYGGLDLAVEGVFDAETAWYSENNVAVTRVFAHHWPGIPNLGDITAIDWTTVEPVDIIAGGFPCQDVSTAGRRAGLAPGTRPGLWSHMAAAIEALRLRWVIAENVRWLLSAPVRRGQEGDARVCCYPATPATATTDDAVSAVRNLEPPTRSVGNRPTLPVLRALGAVLGDLANLGFDTQWCGLPASAIGAPHRFRVFILAHRTTTDSAGAGLLPRQRDGGVGQGTAGGGRAQPPGHRPRQRHRDHRNGPASRAVADDRETVQRWGRFAGAIVRLGTPDGASFAWAVEWDHRG